MAYPTTTLKSYIDALRTAIPAPNIQDLLAALDVMESGRQYQSFDNLLLNGDFEEWPAGAPDYWTLTGAAATVAREATIVKYRRASAKLTRAGTDCTLTQARPEAWGNVGYLAGKVVTFAAWVYATVASRVRLQVADGVQTVYSDYHTGGATWELLSKTVTVDNAATTLKVGLAVDTGNTSGYIDGARLVFGDVAPHFVPTAFDWVGAVGAGAIDDGECRLARTSTTNLRLSPWDGNRIHVKDSTGLWQVRRIPSGGVNKGNGGLAASTLYYVYLYDNSGLLDIEFSATGHSADADTGFEIKTGDATRRLVGMIRTNASSQFEDDTQKFVRSWFHRRGLKMLNGFSTNRTTASAIYVEINTEIRVEFLCWADENVFWGYSGAGQNDTAGDTYTAVAFDGTAQENGSVNLYGVGSTSKWYPLGAAGGRVGLSEGYHYATLIGKTTAGTATWYGGASSTATTLQVAIGAVGGGGL